MFSGYALSLLHSYTRQKTMGTAMIWNVAKYSDG